MTKEEYENTIQNVFGNDFVCNEPAGQCDGYSTVKYIVNTFGITDKKWIEASITHPDWICYPVYVKKTKDIELDYMTEDNEYWIVRVMFGAKDRLVPLGICPTDLSFALPAFTCKTNNYLYIMRMYQFKN